MENSSTITLKDLLKQEKTLRTYKNNTESLAKCIEIITYIENSPSDTIYSTLSSIISAKNQSIYVIFGIYQHLLEKTKFLENDSIKNKYLKLLESSLKSNKDKSIDYLSEKKTILDYFNKKEFDLIEKTILNINLDINSNPTYFNTSHYNKTLSKEDVMITASSKNNYVLLADQSMITSSNSNNAKSVDIDDNRNNISNNSKEINNKDHKKFKANMKLPYVLFIINVNLNSAQVIELINNLMKKISCLNVFKLKENKFEYVSIYKAHNLFFCKKEETIFHLTIILENDENNFSSGTLNILNENERKIYIKSIKGNDNKIQKKILKFLNLLTVQVNKIKILKLSKNFNLNYNLEIFLNSKIFQKKNSLYKKKNLNIINYFNKNNGNSFSENSSKTSNSNKNYTTYVDEDTFIEKQNNFANKFLDIYKLLSKDDYSLGKNINLFINNFKNNYKDFKNYDKINTKEIMIKIIKICEESEKILNSNFNFNTYDNNLYRDAIEQFIYNKIYFTLFEIYNKKFLKTNNIFNEKKKELNKKLSKFEIIKKLGIKNKFISNDENPFATSINLINMIQYEQNPKKKFKNLTQCSLEIRNSILFNSKGKTELDSMDDELPIFIYMCTQVNLNNFYAELNLIDDYLKCTLRDDMIQNKVVTNLMSGFMYISKGLIDQDENNNNNNIINENIINDNKIINIDDEESEYNNNHINIIEDNKEKQKNIIQNNNISEDNSSNLRESTIKLKND